MSFYQNILKRLLDLILAIIALPFVVVICLVLGLIIWREDKGPVFYNAERVGKGGRFFKMYKMRSMKVDSPDLKMSDGSTYNAADDPRMTNIGATMRRTSLDELPQILNVIIGNMSLIGPRPDVADEVALYEGDEERKLEVKPGITGYSQTYVRNSVPWKERIPYDIYYVDNISFLLDVKIFFKTFAVVFKQEGVFNEE